MMYVIGHLFYAIIGTAMMTDAVVAKPIFKVENGVEVVAMTEADLIELNADEAHRIAAAGINAYGS